MHVPLVCCLSACTTCGESLPVRGCPPQAPAGQQVAPPLEAGACRHFQVDATRAWSGSGIVTAAGQRYSLRVLEVLTPWIDAWVPATPEGGWSGLAKPVSALLAWNARAPAIPMYGLACSFEASEASAWPVPGNEAREVTGLGGVLSCFANDWHGFQANNCGCALVEACRER